MVDIEVRNEMAREMASLLGWKNLRSRKGHLYIVNFPYAIYISSCREMTKIKGVLHPGMKEFKPFKAYGKSFLPGTSVKSMTETIQAGMLPKYMNYIDTLIGR